MNARSPATSQVARTERREPSDEMPTYPSDRWRELVEASERVLQHLDSMRERNSIFQRYAELYESNTPPPQELPLHAWIIEGAVSSTAVSIRRQIDVGSPHPSLAALLREIERNAREITYVRVRSMWDTVMLPEGELQTKRLDHRTSELFAGFSTDGVHLDPARLREDLMALRRVAHPLEEWLDTRVALSAGAEQERHAIAFSIVDNALDTLEVVGMRYYTLLTLETWVAGEPRDRDGLDAPLKRLLGPAYGLTGLPGRGDFLKGG